MMHYEFQQFSYHYFFPVKDDYKIWDPRIPTTIALIFQSYFGCDYTGFMFLLRSPNQSQSKQMETKIDSNIFDTEIKQNWVLLVSV